MTHTKKRFHSRSFQRQSPIKRLPWLLVGLFVGILSTLGFSLYTHSAWLHWLPARFSNPHLIPKNPAPADPVSHAAQRKSRKIQAAEPQKAAPTPSERFEFYQLLPGMEVQLPEAEEPHTPPPITSKQAPKTTVPKPVERQQAAAHYIIQAGAYRQRLAAEHLQNRLNQQGFKARIQAVEAEDGAWFRVTLGPFEQESMALQQKKRLQQQRIHGILILQR